MSINKLPVVFLSEIVSSKANTVNAHIAAFILRNMSLIPGYSIRELAKQVNASPATISRFCRDIGLKDYNELKLLASQTHPRFTISSYADSPAQRKDEFIDTVQDSIEKVRKTLDMAKMKKLCQDIRAYPRVAIFGIMKSEGVAMNLQFDLMIQGVHATTKLPYSEQIDYLEQADENDLIILFSYTGVYFDYVPHKLNLKPVGHRPKIYFITSDPKAEESGSYDEVIWFESEHTVGSHPYQLQVIGSLIAQRYAHLLREEAAV